MGFCERFLDALHNVVRGTRAQRRDAIAYLAKLGVGWAIGMGSCVVLLSGLFEQNIYFMSSLFLGLTVCSIPFVAAAERQALKSFRCACFLLLGADVVVGVTLLRTQTGGLGSMNYAQLQPLQYAYLFASGAAAITATPRPALSLATFRPVAFLLGAAVLLALEGIKAAIERKAHPGAPIVKGARQA